MVILSRLEGVYLCVDLPLTNISLALLISACCVAVMDERQCCYGLPEVSDTEWICIFLVWLACA